MKKHFILAFLLGLLVSGLYAQEGDRTAPASGVHCVRGAIGGCVSYGLGTICSEYIYHWQLCCSRPSWGTGYQVCSASSWSTVNPDYRLHSGAAPALGTSLTLEELVKRAAAAAGWKPEEAVAFTVTDSDAFEGPDGNWYVVEKGTYKIDKSTAGWSLSGVQLIPYK